MELSAEFRKLLLLIIERVKQGAVTPEEHALLREVAIHVLGYIKP